ncbi:MAG: glycosyltransferase family 39 protein [Elusimicrobia bacterium]|nr:glycosyltransferase family 39 protein [Elusimicrobiota bacterium]
MTALAARLRRLAAERPAEAALFAAGVLLRAWLLTRRSLWFDEAVTLAVARAPLSDLVRLSRGDGMLPPLHYLLMHFWLKAFADPVLGLRSFSLLCGAAALAVFWRTVRRLSPELALPALAVAALSSYWLDLAQSGRPYALFLLLAAVQLDLFVLLRERWSARRGALYAGVGILGLYTHYYYALLLCSQLADAAWRRRREPRALAPWLATALLWAAAFAPWLASLRAQLAIYSAHPVLTAPFGPKALLDLFGTLFCDVSLLALVWGGPLRAAGASALALVVLVPFLGRLSPAERRVRALGLSQVLLPLAAAALAERVFGRPLTQPRYFVFLSLPAYLLAALSVRSLRGAGRAAAAAALFAVLGAGTFGYEYATLRVDARLAALAAALRRAARPGDVVVHLDPFYYPSLRYHYLRELPNFLADGSSPALDWGALPGYPAVAPPGLIARLPRVLVVDPERRVAPGRLAVSSGAELARLLAGPRAQNPIMPAGGRR